MVRGRGETGRYTLAQRQKKEKQQTGVISQSALDGRACTACKTSNMRAHITHTHTHTHTYGGERRKKKNPIHERTSRQLQEFLLTSSDDATYGKCFVLHRNPGRNNSVSPLTSERK